MAEEIKEPESQKNMDEEDKPTILLVDDNTELLSMLEDIFLPMYNVYTACNGREGLEMAQQIQPDLIVRLCLRCQVRTCAIKSRPM